VSRKSKKEEFRVFLAPEAAKRIHQTVEDEETVYRNPSEVIRDIVYDALGLRIVKS